MVNETLVRRLGLHSPQDILGKTLSLDDTSWRFHVVGVIRDYNSLSLREAIPPMVVTPNSNAYNLAALRLAPERIKETMTAVQRAFASVYPNYLFDCSWLDEKVAHFYQTKATTAQLVRNPGSAGQPGKKPAVGMIRQRHLHGAAVDDQ